MITPPKTKIEIFFSFATLILSKMNKTTNRTAERISRIVEAVAYDFSISVDDLIHQRRGFMTTARHYAMLIAVDTGEFMEQIAEYFGVTSENVRYSTIRHRWNMESSEPARARYNRIRKDLGI